MKRFFVSILVPILLLGVFTGSTYGEEPLGRFLVRIEGPPGPVEREVEASGGRVLYVYEIIPDLIAIQIPETAVSGLKRNPRVTSIEPDATIHAVQEVLPWGVDRIDAELVHSTNKGSGIKVGIIDTGIDKDHPDLDDNIKGGVNFVPRGRRVDPNSWDDDNGHGTHVAGTVAAEDNEEGVIGVAPEASLHAIKVLDRNGSGYYSWIIAGLEWCVTNGIDVANMSLGGEVNSINLEEACENAYSAGVLLVAAAGNENSSSILYPAKYSSVIAVSATDESDERALFSNYGDAIELAAPGVGILSTVKGGGYENGEYWSGTSMAAPHVAGTAALVIASKITDGSAFAVRAKLQNTAKDLGDPEKDIYFGYGLVDAEAAVGGVGPLPLRITTSILPDGIVNQAYSPMLEAAGGTPPYMWSIVDGSGTLPDGLSLNTDTGEISGNPTTVGTSTFTAKVTDSAESPGVAEKILSITITEAPSGVVSVESILFSSKKAGRNLFLYTTVKVVDDIGAPAAGINVEMTLEHESGDSWNFAGNTVEDGTVMFTLKTKQTGLYTATVTNIPDGVTENSCILDSDGTVTQGLAKAVALNSQAKPLTNYPNPFNPETNINYSIKEAGFVSINIYNIMGQVVRTLVNETQGAGFYTVIWNGRDERGRELSSGVYYCRLATGKQSEILKMLLLK